MKTINLLERDYEQLKKLQHLLRTQDTALTDCPAYIVYWGRDQDDPTKRVNVVCLTAEDAQRVIDTTRHQGAQFIYVHSFSRGRYGKWLHNLITEGIELGNEPLATDH